MHIAVDARDDSALKQTLGDLARNVAGCGLPAGALLDISRGQGDFDLLARLLGDPGVPLGLSLVEDGIAGRKVVRRRGHLERPAAALVLFGLGRHGGSRGCVRSEGGSEGGDESGWFESFGAVESGGKQGSGEHKGKDECRKVGK